MIIKCKRLGFINPTEVEANNKILVTQSLSIEDLSRLWKMLRDYYWAMRINMLRKYMQGSEK